MGYRPILLENNNQTEIINALIFSNKLFGIWSIIVVERAHHEWYGVMERNAHPHVLIVYSQTHKLTRTLLLQ